MTNKPTLDGVIGDWRSSAPPADPDTLADRALREAAAGVDRLRERFRLAGDWTTTTPPPVPWLLRTAGGAGLPWAAGGAGVLPLGKVGMIAAAGGVGKSRALADLVVAVATGRPWLRAFEVVKPGAVLAVFAEDDEAEAWRKLHYATAAAAAAAAVDARGGGHDAEARASDEVRRLVAERVKVAALAGTRPGLARVDLGTEPVPSDWHAAILAELAGPPPGDAERWALVVLDPLSRFATGDTEKDNDAATRFVELVERFAVRTTDDAPGPAVILAHHSAKASRRDNDTSGNAIRGVSGLHDGVRWAATMQSHPRAPGVAAGVPDLVVFEQVKSNVGPPIAPVVLARADHGTLRVATPAEVEPHVKAAPNDGRCAELARLAGLPLPPAQSKDSKGSKGSKGGGGSGGDKGPDGMTL